MITKIDNNTAVNLNAIASIKFAGDDSEPAATVNFLATGAGGSFLTETFSGDAARHLYEIIVRHATEEKPGAQVELDESTPILNNEFLRSKSWFFVKGAAGHRYLVAFVNAKGSCSMRTFDADSGRFISRKYRAGNYQQQFADVIQKGVELTVNSQPNLERDCKVCLPESLLVELKRQVK